MQECRKLQVSQVFSNPSLSPMASPTHFCPSASLFPAPFSFSCPKHVKCSFQYHSADTYLSYCCCMLYLGVYLIRNLVKIPFQQLACSGISAKGKTLGGHREMLPEKATWELEQGSSWDRARWEMRL